MEVLGVNIPMVWTLLLGCVGLVYVYGKRRNRLLKDAGLPGPEPTIYLGSMRTMMKEIDLENKLGKQYGPVFGIWLGGIPFVTVHDPDILREVLVKDFDTFTDRLNFDLDNYPLDLGIFNQRGTSWRRLRNIISPTFSGSKLRGMCSGLNNCAKQLTENLMEAARKDEAVDIKRYGKRRHRLLKDAGFPGPEPEIYLGSLRRLLSTGIDFDNELGKKYGQVYAVWLGGVPLVNVLDPEILREVLVKDFDTFTDRLDFDLDNYPLNLNIFNQRGASWRRLRNIISPTFSGSKLRMMCSGLNNCAKHLTENLMEAARKDEAVDIKRYFGGFTMDAIASTAFGIDCGSQSDLDTAFVRETKKVFENSFIENPIIFLILLFPEITPLMKNLGVGSLPKATFKFFKTSIQDIIDARRSEPMVERKKRVDFLELMLAALDDERETTQSGDSKNRKTMTTDEIIGQAFLFFIAGYETTATSLHYVAYTLATEPEVQTKLVEEVDQVIGQNEPDYDNIHQMPYMDRVITETLRLYPVVPGLNRHVSKTTTIKGWTFPKDCFINVPIPVLHRDPSIFPEPRKFKPERWEKKGETENMFYMPFGEGPRHCIGMRLAQVEMKVALAQLLKKVTFHPGPDTPKEFKNHDFKATGVFSPKVPIKLKIELRK